MLYREAFAVSLMSMLYSLILLGYLCYDFCSICNGEPKLMGLKELLQVTTCLCKSFVFLSYWIYIINKLKIDLANIYFLGQCPRT